MGAQPQTDTSFYNNTTTMQHKSAQVMQNTQPGQVNVRIEYAPRYHSTPTIVSNACVRACMFGCSLPVGPRLGLAAEISGCTFYESYFAGKTPAHTNTFRNSEDKRKGIPTSESHICYSTVHTLQAVTSNKNITLENLSGLTASVI